MLSVNLIQDNLDFIFNFTPSVTGLVTYKDDDAIEVKIVVQESEIMKHESISSYDLLSCFVKKHNYESPKLGSKIEIGDKIYYLVKFSEAHETIWQLTLSTNERVFI